MVARDQAAPPKQLAERTQRVARGHVLQQQPEIRPPEVRIHALSQSGGLREPVGSWWSVVRGPWSLVLVSGHGGCHGGAAVQGWLLRRSSVVGYGGGHGGAAVHSGLLPGSSVVGRRSSVAVGAGDRGQVGQDAACRRRPGAAEGVARQGDRGQQRAAAKQSGPDCPQPLVGQHAARQHQRDVAARPRQIDRAQQETHLARQRLDTPRRGRDAERWVADHQVERGFGQADSIEAVGIAHIRQALSGQCAGQRRVHIAAIEILRGGQAVRGGVAQEGPVAAGRVGDTWVGRQPAGEQHIAAGDDRLGCEVLPVGAAICAGRRAGAISPRCTDFENIL